MATVSKEQLEKALDKAKIVAQKSQIRLSEATEKKRKAIAFEKILKGDLSEARKQVKKAEKELKSFNPLPKVIKKR